MNTSAALKSDEPPPPFHLPTRAANPKFKKNTRFIKAEQWRAKLTFADNKTLIAPEGRPMNLDEELADWDKDGELRKKVAPYYPQYYHKTDKVRTHIYSLTRAPPV